MDFKEFSKFLRNKSIPRLLHRARKETSERIALNADDLEAPRRAPARKRTGTR